MRKITLYGHDFYTHAAPLDRMDDLIIREVRVFYDFADVFRWPEINTVLDIGAHIGSFAAYAHYRNSRARIVCLEPEAKNAELCALNVEQFGAHLHVGYCRYLSDDVVLVKNPRNSGNYGMRLTSDTHNLQDDRNIVPLDLSDRVTIGDLMNIYDMPHVDMLKLDIEGGEYNVLASMTWEEKRNIRLIVGEYHGGHDKFRNVVVPILERDFYVAHVGMRDLGRFCFVNRTWA